MHKGRLFPQIGERYINVEAPTNQWCPRRSKTSIDLKFAGESITLETDWATASVNHALMLVQYSYVIDDPVRGHFDVTWEFGVADDQPGVFATYRIFHEETEDELFLGSGAFPFFNFHSGAGELWPARTVEIEDPSFAPVFPGYYPVIFCAGYEVP
jgi:hypothetical protein